MTTNIFLKWAHIIAMAYWLGGEWGVFNAPRPITNTKLSLEERKRHMETAYRHQRGCAVGWQIHVCWWHHDVYALRFNVRRKRRHVFNRKPQHQYTEVRRHSPCRKIRSCCADKFNQLNRAFVNRLGMQDRYVSYNLSCNIVR